MSKMVTVAEKIMENLRPLIGLKLSIARRAADMRGFHFDTIRPCEGGGTVADYALHIQCPWRIENNKEIITGRQGLWQPAQEDDAIDWDIWDYETNENLQDRKIAEFMGSYDPDTRSYHK